MSGLEKVVGLTGFVIIHVFIASFYPAQGECHLMLNAKFTRPVNAMPMSSGSTNVSGYFLGDEGDTDSDIINQS